MRFGLETEKISETMITSSIYRNRLFVEWQPKECKIMERQRI